MQKHDRLALALASGAFELPESGPILVLRATPSDFLAALPRERVVCVQGLRPIHDALVAGGYAVAERFDGIAALAVVELTRSRAEVLGMIAEALLRLAPGGLLVIAGAKADGIDSIARLVAAEIEVEGAFVKAHGRVLAARRPEVLPPVVAAWAAAAAPAQNAEGFVTAPGMFSPEHADPGSRRLAAVLAGQKLAGRVADLGAGWGWLAAEALASHPAIATLDLYEAEAAALAAARVNVRDPRAAFHWADATALGKLVPYDAVITNPPFHQTRAADPALGAAFVVAAARMLKPSGRLWLVANRQLPYEAVLEAAFRRVGKLEEDGAYKVILAEGPRRAA